MLWITKMTLITSMFSLTFLFVAMPQKWNVPEGLNSHAVTCSSSSGETDTTITKPKVSKPEKPATKARTIPVKGVNTWPGGIIPFRIAAEMPDEAKERILMAIRNWESQTPLRFQNLDSLNLEDPQFMARFYYIGARGCSAHVGMKDQKQPVNVTRVNISDRCSVGAIMHEIGHTVGFYHEHQRPGRDEVIKIHWENIKPDKRKTFSLRTRAMSDSIDFESIMMYGSFSVHSVEKKKPVMTQLNGATWKRQRERLSEGDLWKLRLLYPEIF